MKLNVIVIDDSRVQLALASRLLEKNEQLNLIGTYSDAYLGLQAANEFDIDIVLLDVEMPEIDGFSLQKLLKDSVDVIINSSKGAFELYAYMNGAIDFLQKPLNEAKINRSVSRVMEMKQILLTEHVDTRISAG